MCWQASWDESWELCRLPGSKGSQGWNGARGGYFTTSEIVDVKNLTFWTENLWKHYIIFTEQNSNCLVLIFSIFDSILILLQNMEIWIALRWDEGCCPRLKILPSTALTWCHANTECGLRWPCETCHSSDPAPGRQPVTPCSGLSLTSTHSGAILLSRTPVDHNVIR